MKREELKDVIVLKKEELKEIIKNSKDNIIKRENLKKRNIC